MADVNIKSLEFGETVSAHGTDLVADTGDTLFTAGFPGNPPSLLMMMPPKQAIEVGKALLKAGRAGTRARLAALASEQTSQD